MGQILDRLRRVVTSEFNSFMEHDYPERLINADQDELKRIIDELESNYTKSKSTKSDNSGKSDNSKQYGNSSKSESSSHANSQSTNDRAWALGVLGLDANASTDDIKSAYKKRILEYHPDRVEQLGDEIKKLALRKTLDINKANQILTKE